MDLMFNTSSAFAIWLSFILVGLYVCLLYSVLKYVGESRCEISAYNVFTVFNDLKSTVSVIPWFKISFFAIYLVGL